MKFENVIEELKRLKKETQPIVKKIKSHKMPIVIYGAGEMAKWVTSELKGLTIEGYAVDDEYFKPNQSYFGKPIYKINEVINQAKVFVLGMEDEMLGGNKAYNFLRNENIICYPLPINLKGSSQAIEVEYVEEHIDEFIETYNMLEDELSRQTMANYLKLKITNDPKYNWEVYYPSAYFNELTEKFIHGVFIDCGAYNGDTLKRFVDWTGSKYKKVIAIEADPDNYNLLKKFVETEKYHDVELLNCGVWNERGYITFDKNIERTQVSESGTIKVEMKPLDEIVGDDEVNLIKLEIMGSELKALQGANRILKNQKPCLSIMMFHKPEDWITIPQFIKATNSEYKIYLRKQTRIRDNGILLYAIPNEE